MGLSAPDLKQVLKDFFIFFILTLMDLGIFFRQQRNP